MNVKCRSVSWPCRALAGCLALWLQLSSDAHAAVLSPIVDVAPASPSMLRYEFPTNVFSADSPLVVEENSVPSFDGGPLNLGGNLTFSFAPVGNLLALQQSVSPVDQALAAQVIAGFSAAGNRFSSKFNDDIKVNIQIDFPALGANILGSAGSATVGVFYSDAKLALGLDALSADDAVAVANLPAGSVLSFMTNNEATGALEIDSNGSGNNTVLNLNRANAKALGFSGGGLSANDSTLDAAISFSSNFNWDFDPSNGITGGTFDFIGVATHEIGHALGFVSGVDDVDEVSEPGVVGAPTELDPFRVFSVLDLYRHGARNLGGLDFAYGGSGANNPYFSINGGGTSLGTFSTGFYNGDGRQASHWKDSLGLGIMDPTFSSGELGVLTALDLRAFDVIGYDPIAVPEPATLVLAIVGLTSLTRYRRRR